MTTNQFALLVLETIHSFMLYLLIISFILQATTALIAGIHAIPLGGKTSFYSKPYTGNYGWTLFSFMFALMALRRGITLWHYFFLAIPIPNENIVSLINSVLALAGVILLIKSERSMYK